MKKITLLTVSVLALASVGLTATAQLAHADDAGPQTTINSSGPQAKDPGITILDKGEFVNPITLDAYNYDLNKIPGFETGKVVMEYDSTSLFTIAIGETKHFNLKLPSEFNRISGLNGGANLKSAITAQYKLPGSSDYTDFKPEDITTSYEGQIDFKLSATSLVNIGQTTKIKVQINYGKILDDIGQGHDFNYKTLIPDSTSGGYVFQGILTDDDWINIWPEGGATGVTDGIRAALSAPVINASDVTVKIGDSFDPMANVTAHDEVDGEITSKITITSNDVDTTKAGVYHVTYEVTNSSGITTEKTITVTVEENK